MELIKIGNGKIGDGDVQTVNARELHSFLEVKTRFSDWIKRRIEEFGFTENIDFTVLKKEYGEITTFSEVEYHLSIDMAKELSMVERNEKGKQARQYFIECERRAKQDPIVALNDPHVMRNLLLSYSEKVIQLEGKMKEQEPKVIGFDRLSYADGLTCMTNAAKDLQIRPSDLIKWLSENRWIYKRAGGSNWIAYQDKIQQGLLSHKVTTITTSDGREKTHEQVLVTAKGIAKLSIVFQFKKNAA